jgi:hypothetical protein
VLSILQGIPYATYFCTQLRLYLGEGGQIISKLIVYISFDYIMSLKCDTDLIADNAEVAAKTLSKVCGL